MIGLITKLLRRSDDAASSAPHAEATALNAAPETNTVVVGENVMASIEIEGNYNTVKIDGASHQSTIRVLVSGDYNTVKIGRLRKTDKLTIRVGNHRQAFGATVSIGEGLSSAHNCEFLVPNSLSSLSIGRNCLLSRDIIIRCGESPHLIFDKSTAEYLDVSDGVLVGDHVWIGERVYLTKRASIPDYSIVAACAVVTRQFTEPNVVLAGNPAKVVRRDVQWFQNYTNLVAGSEFRQAWADRDDFAKQEAQRRYLARMAQP